MNAHPQTVRGPESNCARRLVVGWRLLLQGALHAPSAQLDVNTGLQIDEGSDEAFLGIGLARRFEFERARFLARSLLTAPAGPVDIDARTRLITLLGHPVEHSLSPQIHNTAFREQGVNAVYVAAPVRPEDVGTAVDGLRALQVLGANVTVPHKEAVLPHLDRVAERAAAVGAVNTIAREERADGRDLLRGDNTDVEGFLAPLRDRARARLNDAPMVVFGAGGAARAVVFALLTEYRPERLTVVARRPQQAERLAEDVAEYDGTEGLAVSTFEDATDAVRRARLLVNATPVGMAPETDATPWADAEDFDPEQVVYDLVYTPEQTRFLREAGKRGATTIGGLHMLVEQAAAAYVQWTGREMPRNVVYEALRS